MLSAWSSAGRLPQRVARLRDPRGGAVVAAGDLREPLRARRAARRPPVAAVVGRAHDLRDPLLDPRLLRRARPAHADAPPALAHRLIDRPIHRREHAFDPTSARPPTVTKRRAGFSGHLVFPVAVAAGGVLRRGSAVRSRWAGCRRSRSAV